MVEVQNKIHDQGLLTGVVIGKGVRVEPAPEELRDRLLNLVHKRRSEDFPPVQVKDAVRDLLRKGGFRPSGRNKPASEYLAQAAREDRFPHINNLVDINNYVSLYSGLPISLLDLEKTSDHLLLRFGREGEKYVFNNAGQEIDLQGLITLCRADSTGGLPLGNPVKDSLEGKISGQTTSVVGVIYAPRFIVDNEVLTDLVQLFARMLSSYSGASETEVLAV